MLVLLLVLKVLVVLMVLLVLLMVLMLLVVVLVLVLLVVVVLEVLLDLCEAGGCQRTPQATASSSRSPQVSWGRSYSFMSPLQLWPGL